MFAATPPPVCLKLDKSSVVSDLTFHLRENLSCSVRSRVSGTEYWTFDQFTRGRIVDSVLYIEVIPPHDPGRGGPSEPFDRVVIGPNLCVAGRQDAIHVSKGPCK